MLLKMNIPHLTIWYFTVQDNSETDTDPEEVNNRMRAEGLGPTRKQQKVRLKKRKDRMNLKHSAKKQMKLLKKEKENNNRDANKRPKVSITDSRRSNRMIFCTDNCICSREVRNFSTTHFYG